MNITFIDGTSIVSAVIKNMCYANIHKINYLHDCYVEIDFGNNKIKHVRNVIAGNLILQRNKIRKIPDTNTICDIGNNRIKTCKTKNYMTLNLGWNYIKDWSYQIGYYSPDNKYVQNLKLLEHN
jgi:hypothetical protein